MEKRLDPLTLPTDREILQKLTDKKRYTPKLVSLLLDKDPSYIAGQLRQLESREYIIDPAEEYESISDRSGMYTLTPLGVVVTFHLDTYVREQHRVFDSQSRLVLEKQPDDTPHPDLVTLDGPMEMALQELTNVDGVTIASEIQMEIERHTDYGPHTALQALYALYYYGLAERVENMDVYRITDRGEKAAELVLDGITDPVELTEQLRETYSNEEWDRLNKARG